MQKFFDQGNLSTSRTYLVLVLQGIPSEAHIDGTINLGRGSPRLSSYTVFYRASTMGDFVFEGRKVAIVTGATVCLR